MPKPWSHDLGGVLTGYNAALNIIKNMAKTTNNKLVENIHERPSTPSVHTASYTKVV